MAAIDVYTTASGRLDLSSTPLNEVLDAIKDQGLAWIDIRSPDAEVRDFLSNTLAVDELALEDVFGEATTASLKFQDHRFYVVIARHPHERLDTEAVSIFVTEGLMSRFGIRRFLRFGPSPAVLPPATPRTSLWAWTSYSTNCWTPSPTIGSPF